MANPARPRPGARWGLVLAREAIRTSRRWQTYALRVGFTTAGLAMVVVLLLAKGDDVDIASWGRIGETLFLAYVGVQLALVAVATPALVTQALLEERDEGTAELLALTGVGPKRVFAGRVLSRLGIVTAVVVGGAPILALVLTLGGTDPAQVVMAPITAVLVASLLAVVAGAVAQVSRSVAAPVVAAGGHAFFVGLLGPIGVAEQVRFIANPPPGWMGGGDFWIVAVSPVLGFVPAEWAGMFAVGVWTPAVLRTAWVGARLYAEGSDRGWEAVRGPWWRGTWILPLGVLGTSTVLLVPAAHAGLSWVMLFATLMALSATELWVRVAVRLVRWMEHGRRRRLPFLTVVWPNPVAWRESVTAGHGSASRLVVLLGALVLGATVALAGWNGPQDASYFLLLLGVFATNAGGALLVAAATIGERSGQGLDLLVQTGFRPRRIVLGKLVGAAVRTLPLLVLVGVLFAVLNPDDLLGRNHYYWDYPETWREAGPLGGPVLRGPLWRLVGMTAWLLAGWLLSVSLSLWASLTLRPAGLAWGVAAAGVPFTMIAWMVTGVVLSELSRELPSFKAVGALMMPFLGNSWRMGGVPPELVVSTGLLLGLAVLALIAASRRIERVVARN